MVRIGESWLWIGAVVVAIALPSPAAAQKAARPDPTKQIEALDQSIQTLRNEVQALQEQVRELSERLLSLADEQRTEREAAGAQIETGKQTHEELRELLRGLYVESSGIKADVAQAREDVQAVSNSMESFRLSSGILIAVVIVLQVILAALALRGGKG